MPVHRCSTAPGDLEKAVAEIERTSVVVSVIPQGDNAVLIFTTAKARRTSGGKETR